MNRRTRILSLAAVCSTLALGSCTSGVFETPEYLAVTINPRPSAVAVDGSVVLTATVSNNLGVPVWSLLDTAYAGNLGTLTPITGQPNSILYTAPAAAPIYSGVPTAGFVQGTVSIDVAAPPPLHSTLTTAYDSITVFITAPTITVGVSPVAATVALNTSLLFTGYAVGSVDNALTWEVNGVAGGSTTTGSITTTGYYTAPAAYPVTGNTVTITAVSQADPTKSASAAVTLQ